MKRFLVVFTVVAVLAGFLIALSILGPGEIAADDPTPTPTPTQAPGNLRYAVLNYGSDYNTDINATTVFSSAFEARTPHTAEYLGCITVDNLNSSVDVLWMTGHNAFSFSAYQRIILRDYLDNGGVIWGDSCDPGSGGAWAQSFINEMNIITESTSSQINNSHALYKSFYDLDGAPPTALGNYSNIGWEYRGGTRVIISPNDYMCGLEDGEGWSLENSLQMSINLNIYAMYLAAPDVTGPTLDSIEWNNINGNCWIDTGDQLVFCWSEAMNASTVTAENVNDCLDSTSNGYLDYGDAGLAVEWNSPDNTRTTVTIGSDHFICSRETVNPAYTVLDAAGNEDATPFPGPSIPDAIDVVSPSLNSIVWVDINLNTAIDTGDQLIFCWSEAMNTSSVTVASVNTNLDSTATGFSDYGGAGLQVAWNSPDNTQTTVTLGTGEAIAGGEMVNPIYTVTDPCGNPDSTVGAGVQIPSVTSTPPAIVRSPAALTFAAVVNGSNPASQYVLISNSGTQTLVWDVSHNQSWLSLSPASGSNAGVVNCSVNISGLAAGTYNDIITITGAGATNSPQTVAVTLDISVPVLFPDPGLEAAVRDAIGKPSGDIYQSDLDVLTSLQASSRGISDLTGIEHCINLNSLYLLNNGISNLSALSGLTSLSTLNLYNNQIIDIQPLSGLSNMNSLYLDMNHISNISALSALTGLSKLGLAGNEISDISMLSNLTNLSYLELGNNDISDISVLSGLTNLQLWLSLNNNQVSNISALSGLTNLEELSLAYNQISDISPLSGLTSLRTLFIYSNQISDISSLSSVTNLRTLFLFDNQISDISSLSGLISLNVLMLGDNDISDISALSSLTALEELSLNNNQIGGNISALAGLTNLWNLGLSNTQIDDVSPLSGLTSMRYLYLSSNQLSDISILAGLSNLSNLELGSNQINNISAITSLTDLTSLVLSNNQISNISSLSGLTDLRHLNLNDNQISDVSVLSGLVHMEHLCLTNNRISDISSLSGLTDMKYLYLDGNQINDVSALSGLTGLIVFKLDYNQVSDISPLYGLTDLAYLDISGNQLSNISVLSTFTNLGDLFLNANQISDISPLSGLTKLYNIELIGNQISDVTPLSGLTGLTRINIGDNNISDMSPLSGLTNLNFLYIYGNQLTDISSLSSLTNIDHLTLGNNQISDISALSDLNKLTFLGIDRNQITDISPLSGLSDLDTLWLNDNQITNISALSGLSDLTALYLGENNISDISALSGLTGLTYLSAYSNHIVNIAPLSGLVNLAQLYIGDNQISDVSALSNLNQIQILQLSSNQISDIAPLVNNSGLASGDYINLRENPLTVTSINTHIPVLQARGVAVDYTKPFLVWVDDDYTEGSCGGHTWQIDSFDSIQDGIDHIDTGAIFVAPGTYYENIVLKNNVYLFGAGSAVTTIDGMRNGSVVTAINIGSTTEIDGFTITNGSAALRGGGIYNQDAYLLISNCTFENNIAPYGAGMCNYNASPEIDNCTFSNNSATSGGGIYNRETVLATINGCVFYNNSASQRGGAIENYDAYCAPDIVACVFQSNRAITNGGGMHNGQNSAPTIDACIFHSNTANLGGGVYSYTSSATITNCIFNNNSATSGGGIYNSGSMPSPSIINCDLWNNSAISGGGMYNFASTPGIDNCIVWNNIPDGIYNNACLPSAGHSDVQGGIYVGEDNIDVDPLFVNASAGDFHLRPGSPCIDAGSNLAPAIPSLDYDGDPRIYPAWGTVDMGADEYVSTVPPGYSGDNTGDGGISISDYSSLRLMLLGKKAFYLGGDVNGDGELSISDYSALRLMLLGRRSSEPQYQSSYDFSSGAGTNRWAKSNSLSIMPPTLSDNFDTDSDGWVGAAAGDYINIAFDDTSPWTIAGTSGNYSALQCKFTVDVNPEAITSIGVTLNGSAGTNGYCMPGCPLSWIGDGYCDSACNTANCSYDGGDCDVDYCAPGCPPSWIGDGYCDAACNNANCSYDSGDCSGDFLAGFGKNTFVFSTSLGEDDCAPGCTASWLGDGVCDTVCNNAACNYDAGDCGMANTGSLEIWAWNFNTSSWRQIGSDFTITGDIASYSAWTAWGKVYSDYVDDDGYMYILTNLNNANQALNVDYIELKVAW